MKILMIAPEPFYEPRGTPFSEFCRLQALSELGHTVDLVTYPVGEDVNIGGVRIFRCWGPPWIQRVGIGPSFNKFVLDWFLLWKARQLLRRDRYDVLHTHEEAALMGALLRRLYRLPHVYDMHSSLAEQMENFQVPAGGLLARIWRVLERIMIRRADQVIVICPHLIGVARERDPSKEPMLIENLPVADHAEPPADVVDEFRHRWGMTGHRVVLYTGTLEAYQGLDLLLAAMARVHREVPEARLLVVGGKPEQVRALENHARALGIGDVVIFTGQRPVEEIAAFTALADVLVSPRVRGSNTPLKIYSYLQSGKPIVATDLPTHTQVLTPATSILTAPEPEGLAAGIVRVLNDGPLAADLAAAARSLAQERYGRERYLSRVRAVFERFERREARADRVLA